MLSSLITEQVNIAINEYALDAALFVVDENNDLDALTSQIEALISNKTNVSCITNRFDISKKLKSHCLVQFSDFSFDEFADSSLPLICYRISKEKPVTHQVLSESYRCLKESGVLLIFGRKTEGIKTYFDKCRKVLGFRGEIKKQGDFYTCLLRKTSTEPHTLDNGIYMQTTSFTSGEQLFISKPGLYGWDKIDQGSKLLIDQIEAHRDTFEGVTSLLDLGCGYGFLSVSAAKLLQPKRIVATDNNYAAVAMCQRNLAQLHRSVDIFVHADDCGASLEEKFDLIVCNPPFHQGFKNDYSLTEKFISTANRLCKSSGQCIFVFNAFIPAERIAQKSFGTIRTLANNKQFKVLLFKP